MANHAPTIGFVVLLVGVGAYAVFHGDSTPPEAQKAAAEPAVLSPPAAQTSQSAPALTSTDQPMPPGHPPMGQSGPNGASAASAMPVADDDAPAITWKQPTAWTTVPNPSAMRLFTYRVPRATGVTDDADLAVMRAGGSTDANIQRWIGQFDNPTNVTQTPKTVHGLKTTIVEVTGTFKSGGMMGGAATPKSKWTMLAAIVETAGTPYFFKLTGPTASVQGAKAAFLTMLDSITPTST